MHLKLEPPAGHVWNTDAPHHLSVMAENDRLTIGEVPNADANWDVKFSVTASGEGTSDLHFQVIAYFCEEDVPEFCRFVALELALPVTVTEEGDILADVLHGTDIE